MHNTNSTDILKTITPTKLRPIRILHIVGGMNRGGIETWLMHVLRHIDRDRFQMDFLVHTKQPCAYDNEIRDLGSKIIPCLHPSQPWLYAHKFKRILSQYGPYDVVHSQVYLFSGFILRLADQGNIPIKISHIHPSIDLKEKGFLRPIYRKLMVKWISKYATRIIAPSKSTLESFRAICDCSSQHTDILYNGVELEHFAREIDRISVRKKFSLPIDKFIVIYVARFAPHKNHLQMLRIAEQINQDGYQVHLVMVGSHGELLTSLKEKVHNRDDISIITEVEDISGLLNAADLFFFPSLNEGFGIVAIEAAAASLPIVATNLPTISEACCPSHQSFMFPPNDDEVACKNILTILKDGRLRERLSADAKQWAANFSILKSVTHLVSIYNMCN